MQFKQGDRRPGRLCPMKAANQSGQACSRTAKTFRGDAPGGWSGWPAPRLTLGRHSGRAALRAKMAELGYDLGDNEPGPISLSGSRETSPTARKRCSNDDPDRPGPRPTRRPRITEAGRAFRVVAATGGRPRRCCPCRSTAPSTGDRQPATGPSMRPSAPCGRSGPMPRGSSFTRFTR